MSCKNIGSTNADIAGLGVVLAFTIQGGISLVLSAWSWVLRGEEVGGFTFGMARVSLNIGKSGKEMYKLKRESIDKILATAADTQVLTGIALLLSSLIQHKSLVLYHYHIVYDTVNFTCVSFCAAIVCCFSKNEERISRLIAIAIFSILYLAFAITFGIRLRHWSLTDPGCCYNTRLIAASSAKHPLVDQVYLGITCFYTFCVLYTSIDIDTRINKANEQLDSQPRELEPGLPTGVQEILGAMTTFKNKLRETQLDMPTWLEDLLWSIVVGELPSIAGTGLWSEPFLGYYDSWSIIEARFAALNLDRRSQLVLSCALLQYPLHLYNVFALRVSNQRLLAGESENTWGFGQIVALVMLAQTFIECFRGVKAYREKKRCILAAQSLRSIADGLKSARHTAITARNVARRETL